MKAGFVAVAAFAVGIASSAFADDCLRDSYGNTYCGSGECRLDAYGKVYCAKQGGGAMRDQYGKVVCGQGHCSADPFGRIKCSARPGGHVLVEGNGDVFCQESCQDASPQLCELPTKLSDSAARG
jgi:hypothetical protein